MNITIQIIMNNYKGASVAKLRSIQLVYFFQVNDLRIPKTIR